MEMLLTIAVWAGLFYLMMRFGCGSHIMGNGHNAGQEKQVQTNADTPELRWMPAEKDVDPVCKKTVSTNTAKPSVYDGKVYYFCSRDCREIFEAAPEIYTNEDGKNQKPMEPAHA